jgi:hypothetical protein
MMTLQVPIKSYNPDRSFGSHQLRLHILIDYIFKWQLHSVPICRLTDHHGGHHEGYGCGDLDVLLFLLVRIR